MTAMNAYQTNSTPESSTLATIEVADTSTTRTTPFDLIGGTMADYALWNIVCSTGHERKDRWVGEKRKGKELE